MGKILVMKFGGTSMGSADRIRVAAHISAEQQALRPVVTVVSAMSKVTDLLIHSMRKAEAGDQTGLDANIDQLRRRHCDACRELLPANRHEAALAGIDKILSDFSRLAKGMMMLGECPPRSIDEALAVGERLSALMLAEFLQSEGIRAAAVNGGDVITTDAVFGNATPLMPQTRARVASVLKPMLDARILPIVTGFNASTEDHRPTTLGRGGSDFTASILAAAIDASELWIWTDVDGIMTGDPRLVSDARVLEEVTYSEAAELAYNGAKVLHPRTLAPLVESQIPVWSKNSFAPEKRGTRIVPQINVARGPHAVTSMSDAALVSIEPANSTLSGTKVMARALDALARENVEVLAITSSSYRQNFCFLVRQSELERVTEYLEDSLSLELAHGYVKPIQVDSNVGLIAVVGEGMRGTPGLAGRIFTAISQQQINIIAIAQGSSELTIAIVVHRDGLERAVRAIHSECGLGNQPAAGASGK